MSRQIKIATDPKIFQLDLQLRHRLGLRVLRLPSLLEDVQLEDEIQILEKLLAAPVRDGLPVDEARAPGLLGRSRELLKVARIGFKLSNLTF